MKKIAIMIIFITTLFSLHSVQFKIALLPLTNLGTNKSTIKNIEDKITLLFQKEIFSTFIPQNKIEESLIKYGVDKNLFNKSFYNEEIAKKVAIDNGATLYITGNLFNQGNELYLHMKIVITETNFVVYADTINNNKLTTTVKLIKDFVLDYFNATDAIKVKHIIKRRQNIKLAYLIPTNIVVGILGIVSLSSFLFLNTLDPTTGINEFWGDFWTENPYYIREGENTFYGTAEEFYEKYLEYQRGYISSFVGFILSFSSLMVLDIVTGVLMHKDKLKINKLSFDLGLTYNQAMYLGFNYKF